ncbi:LysR family transcriptional regulator [Pseudorhodoferax sp.]|uniref:LysR family transcriptional regulator n=1 Tax=Pseudorhodoferax sp. TaxID=1993553 RepID=UPI0039E23C52
MLNLDLRLLEIFEEIYRTKSVSAAAASLGLAQSSVSMGLRRLRERFGDPLFVRTSAGMEPTPRAAELWQPLAQARALIVDALRRRSSFDPQQSTRGLRLCMTDVSQVVMLPALQARLAQEAPHLGIEVLPVSADTPRLLEQADAELAIGSIGDLEGGFMEQALFDESFVCVARAGHPRIGRTLTLRAFREASHVEIVAQGTSHWLVARALQAQGLAPRIGLKLPSFLAAEAVVARTDLVCTVPRRLAESMGDPRLRIHEPPFDVPAYRIKQHWHARYQHDARSRWLRALVVDVFRSSGRGARPVAGARRGPKG